LAEAFEQLEEVATAVDKKCAKAAVRLREASREVLAYMAFPQAHWRQIHLAPTGRDKLVGRAAGLRRPVIIGGFSCLSLRGASIGNSRKPHRTRLTLPTTGSALIKNT
jgi:hypothetical protein